MTKNQAKQHKVEWNQALTDGRVVRFEDGLTLRSFLTPEAARNAINVASITGIKAEIVVVA